MPLAGLFGGGWNAVVAWPVLGAFRRLGGVSQWEQQATDLVNQHWNS
ncbi:hypothetical protein AB0H28_02455 [Micromonospora sp. NPDC050980]